MEVVQSFGMLLVNCPFCMGIIVVAALPLYILSTLCHISGKPLSAWHCMAHIAIITKVSNSQKRSLLLKYCEKKQQKNFMEKRTHLQYESIYSKSNRSICTYHSIDSDKIFWTFCPLWQYHCINNGTIFLLAKIEVVTIGKHLREGIKLWDNFLKLMETF